jgi:hypothetical protein
MAFAASLTLAELPSSKHLAIFFRAFCLSIDNQLLKQKIYEVRYITFFDIKTKYNATGKEGKRPVASRSVVFLHSIQKVRFL